MRSLLLALSLLSALCSATSDVFALDITYKRAFVRELRFIVAKHPRYTWGGAQDLTKGLDCSGYVYLAGKWAGIPGIVRTTSYRMALGLDGWIGRDVPVDRAEECDLSFWSWKKAPRQSYGHVGVFLNDKGELRVTHASSSRGVVLVPLRGVLQTDLSKVRRLTVGE